MNHPVAKIRIFVANPLEVGGTVTLTGLKAHYVATVMCQKIGAHLLLFNGVDGEWLCRIETANKKEVLLAVRKNTRTQAPEPDLWLVFAPIKKGRIDYLAEKATELGVSRLIPVKTERTVVSRVKTSRLLANAQVAAEQCERLTVPTVSEMESLESLLANWPVGRNLLFCDEQKEDPSILEALKAQNPETPWGILIGPEGGFSEHERNLIRSFRYCIPTSIGPRVLRADTAAFAAISLWQAAIGDWV
ncbi:MAG: 16S rRNA (uracil(1498)-N(3))-methyltransferase [Alphaproteobacteria bacterium]|nr:MAG: 16S rRNA (uracil(1498)-N(3))-methyltransferase [Alphaproteobacteria bacterium]